MSSILIKNLPKTFGSFEIDYSEYNKEKAKTFSENILEFLNDIKLSNDIEKSNELSEVLNLIDKKV